jgi:hypothetical protein
MQTKAAWFLARVLIGLVVAALGCGFAYIKNTTTGLPLKWPPGSILMKISADGIGTNGSRTLTDGTTEATSIQNAMKDPSRGWNQYLGNQQFAPTIVAAGTAGMDNNGINEIFFSNTVFGKTFGSDGTLAVTTAWYTGNQRVEADIIFNSPAWTWDSYRGVEHSNPVDLQRVALHELGHVLGLDHPDDAGQTVTAVMNSIVSNTDSLTADDIAGGQSLYGPPGIPANDNFAAAITLSGSSATGTGFNTNATKESGEPSHAGNAGGRSVWWKWTAPSGGTATVTTQGSVFDTTLGVYTGAGVNALTTIASNDDVTQGVVQYSSVTFPATGGVTYYFAVDGFNASDGHGADCGAVTLNLSFASSGTTSTTTSTTTITSTTTTTTIPPTPPLSTGGGGGGGGAPSTWFLGALGLLACLRRMFPKRG